MSRVKPGGRVDTRPGSKAGAVRIVAARLMAAHPLHAFTCTDLMRASGHGRTDVYTALNADPAQFVRVGIGKFQLRKGKGEQRMQELTINGGEIKAGDVLYSDGTHPCLPAGERLVVLDRHGALYVMCQGGTRGRGAHVLHFLDNDVDDETGEVVGFSRVPIAQQGAA